MINKDDKEYKDILKKRKELAISKRRKRFARWTPEDIKFMYGKPTNEYFENTKIKIPKAKQDNKYKKIEPIKFDINIKFTRVNPSRKEMNIDGRNNKQSNSTNSTISTDRTNTGTASTASDTVSTNEPGSTTDS